MNKGFRNWGRLVIAGILLMFLASLSSCRRDPYAEGQELMNKGNYEGAAEFFKNQLEKKPDDAMLHNEYGFALMKLYLYKDAQTHYLEAIRLQSEYPEAHYNLGTTLLRMGQNPEAVKEFKVAIEQRPSYTEAYNRMGLAYYHSGKFDEAIESFKHAIQMNPDNPTYKDNLERVTREKEKYNEKTKEFLKQDSTGEKPK
jgi:tetratricopeptide (TPR) repeat protein